MIKIKNVRTVANEVVDYQIPSSRDDMIDAQGKLLILPGIIDPHVCLGMIGSKTWNTSILSSIKGGLTTAIEVPQEDLLHNTRNELEQKNKHIEKNLWDLGIPLNYLYYLPYSSTNLSETEELGISRQFIKGIYIRLDSKKNETLDDDWNELFRLGAQEDIPVVINIQNENTKTKPGQSLLEKAIHFTEKWSNRLYVLNISAEWEIDLIKKAKDRALLVYTETTLQHIQDQSKAKFLWKAIHDDIIETIGSGFNVDQPSRTKISYKGNDYDESNPLFLLPTLLTAVHEKKVSIDKVVRLTSGNIQDMLELQCPNDYVLVDMEKEEKLKKNDSHGSSTLTLKGWPVYTIVNGLMAHFQIGE